MSTTPAAHDYDSDPDALRWARHKIQREIDKLTEWQRLDNINGEPERAEQWRVIANVMRRKFIGGRGCCIAAFDERRPELARAMAAAPRMRHGRVAIPGRTSEVKPNG